MESQFVTCQVCGAQAKVRYMDDSKVAIAGPEAIAQMRRENTAFRCQECGGVMCFSCAMSETLHGIPVCPLCGAEGGPYFFKR